MSVPIIPRNRDDWRGWLHPVPAMHGRPSVSSQEFRGGARYKGDGSLNYANHLGVDIAFRWQAGDPTEPSTLVALNASKTRGYIAWPGTLVRAAGPGTIWAAGTSPLGRHVQIDHGTVGSAGGVNTFYQHLESFARPWAKGDVVNAGDVLGLMGGDPANAGHWRHLHFEIWFPRAGLAQGYWPQDPQPFLDMWAR